LSSTKTPSHSETCFVSGWGFTKGDKKGGISNDLLYGKIPVVGFSECLKTGPWYKLQVGVAKCQENIKNCVKWPQDGVGKTPTFSVAMTLDYLFWPKIVYVCQ